MIISETKIKDGYKYEVNMAEGFLWFMSEKPIRTKKTKKTLDDIFMKVLNSGKDKGRFIHEDYKITFNKDLKLWSK